MIHTPKKRLFPLSITILTLTISALILAGFSLTTEGIAARAMLMTSAVIFFTATLLVTRFVVCGFAYKAMDFEFLVIKSYGKKRTTVCRLYYTDITAVITYNNAKKQLKDKIVYDYRASIAPKNKLCIFFQTGDEDGVVIIEADESLKKHLDKYIQTDTTIL